MSTALPRLALPALVLAISCQTPAPVSVPGKGQGAAAAIQDRAAETEPSGPPYSSVRIEGVPHVRQKPDFCGEACAEMVLRKLGHDEYDQDAVFDRAGVDPLQARGAWTADLKRALEAIGFAPGQTWYRVEADSAEKDLEARFGELHADLKLGIPSIVCMHYSDSPGTTEHFRLVLGYDAEKDQVLYHEPAEDNGAYRRMDRSKFLALWPLKYNAEVWSVIRFRMTAETIKRFERPARFTAADFAQHCMELKPKLARGQFNVLIEPPFVVIGDMPRKQLAVYAEHTVRASVDALRQAYFERDPEQVLDIWLFKDDASYRKHTHTLFNDDPDTPYGYYSEDDRALIMNIDTGGGTLIHEIVHPFVATNFPDCPAWLNEGLGSLYEQSQIKGRRIKGLTNWRLAGLQAAIGEGAVPSFEYLTSRTEQQFYGEDPGTNYAQARYLCYFLQEQGKLRRFYHDFHDNRQADPTGFETLKAVLGQPDLVAFQKSWEEYVLGLVFR